MHRVDQIQTVMLTLVLETVLRGTEADGREAKSKEFRDGGQRTHVWIDCTSMKLGYQVYNCIKLIDSRTINPFLIFRNFNGIMMFIKTLSLLVKCESYNE